MTNATAVLTTSDKDKDNAPQAVPLNLESESQSDGQANFPVNPSFEKIAMFLSPCVAGKLYRESDILSRGKYLP
jgi:hypothetical protein